MIHEVDEGLRQLLAEAGLEEAGVDLVFDAPTRDWSARRNAPTVSAFLYDIQEDTTRRRSGTGEEYDADGLVVAWRTPPRWFKLTYLVTAWTNRPQDEHRLLSQVLRCLIAQEMLPRRVLTGSLAELGLALPLFTAGGPDGQSASDVWPALGGELKASISVTVTAPLAGERTPAGPPVTEGLVVKPVAASSGTDDDVPRRQLRYEGIRDPGPDGFSSPRERRPTPARRRRGGRQE
ncbi:DUF4255 domain-containing protein [Streptantibioticus rubrisoli]|uniref:DUF4255 domain-containing protein n=1 Tax=Streptantibioticus rubrisoli TaxID=1387313 RepID=A0ABT1PIC0_9ACTN|nr:DUF4255 domain-containing protein [Streptantibioticus rubrisoli]MCQ4045109.1 DUF4255 domain-containing protein [Streptantibioticus rubrisoli]